MNLNIAGTERFPRTELQLFTVVAGIDRRKAIPTEFEFPELVGITSPIYSRRA